MLCQATIRRHFIQKVCICRFIGKPMYHLEPQLDSPNLLFSQAPSIPYWYVGLCHAAYHSNT
ncbi:hypothetical protein I7I50_11928 [Histoplasma capsulatum G186AR]|uniref:Uncharacterized protein n=1 Tax=Ajellomyces capsulatus TaxID=5037 RepID=A0A8H8CRB6_AJECA|nr:hypothetical protein I7I52_11760 [Histoplasma capsulatum]QSS70333.1 hypothetical protein I7I50_11928 [Histoplasma capsulatum G186AR]